MSRPTYDKNRPVTTDLGAAEVHSKKVRAYLDRAARVDQPCIYGHFGCAAFSGGPCSDELLSAEKERSER